MAHRTEHVPPHNCDAEESLLGSMLLSHDAIVAADTSGVTVSDFYVPTHQHVYEAVPTSTTSARRSTS